MSMEPASSSSACSSDDDEEIVPVKPIQSLDDLPSDDSVTLASSTDKEEEEMEDAAIAHSSSDDSSDSASEDNREDRSRDGDVNDDFDEDHVPLEERVRQRREAGLSKKARADARERKSRALQVASQRLRAGSTTAVVVKKKSKHAPTEASSKRSDYYKRGAPQLNSSGVGVEIGAHRYRPRDPRVTELVDPGRVNDTFAFLQELRNEEISSLKKKVAIHKLPGKKGQRARRKMGIQQESFKEDQEELKRLLQEKATYERAQLDRKAKQAVKRKLNENRTAGKGVYHLKKREMKRLKLEAKFEEMRKVGGDAAVDKALAKRRKKNMSKDTGFMPRDL